MEIISFENYSFQYALGAAPAIQNIDLSVSEGEILVICGKSGSGKSTLLRCIKKDIRPAGADSGKLKTILRSHEIAIVFQDPDTQLVNQTVMDDLIFHMENLGYDNASMKKNMAETVGFFGLEPILHRNVNELSGGQKQLVALCAALMLRPKVLLLDEPVSQLDPIAAREFWDTVLHVNKELGVSLIITEHRMDQIIAFAERIAIMREGSISYLGEPKEIFTRIYTDNNRESLPFIPDIPLLCLSIGLAPYSTPNEFQKNATADNVRPLPKKDSIQRSDKPILRMKNIFFSYEHRGTEHFILRNLFLDLYKGEKLCLLGGNGAGKSTLLKLLCKIIRPLSGSVSIGKNRVAYMPQEIRSFFRFETVRAELRHSAGGEIDSRLPELFGIGNLLERHPLDLSGGEAQKLVLACILMTKPDIILLDEPTRGLDPYAKQEIGEILRLLPAAIVMATHDMSFAAGFAERCAMLFDGSISFSAPPQDFFSFNRYYTTPVNRGVRHICPHAITYEEALSLWK